MASYRFCRPDDIPYLVRAVNECYDCHFPATKRMTLESFRGEMKELDVWPSNSMVASSGAGPVAVLIATKRADEVLVSRVGVHPDHFRKGHASHIVMSLSHKLAVLGPEKIVVEVPESLSLGIKFFESIGFRSEATLTDYWSAAVTHQDDPFEQLVGRVTVGELAGEELFESHFSDQGVAWHRARQTLLNIEEELEGLVLASPVRIEAFVFFRRKGSMCEILTARAWMENPRQQLFLEALIRRASAECERLEMKRVAAGELTEELCVRLDLQAGERYHRMVGRAEPS